MSRTLKRTLRRWLYIGHRWVGIITCLFFAMWFISGVVMMYVAFPGLSDKERLAALPDIRWEKVALSPDDAMKKAGVTRYPRDLRLSMLADEPVYRMTAWDGTRQVISAGRWPRHHQPLRRTGAGDRAIPPREQNTAARRDR